MSVFLMKTITILFPDKRQETMLLRSDKVKQSKDIVKALQQRHTIRVDECQLDIDDYFNEGYISFSDAITGDHIVSVTW